MGGTLMNVGELDASKHHFEAALAAYDEEHPQRSALGSDLGVFAHAWYAHTLWLLGDESALIQTLRSFPVQPRMIGVGTPLTAHFFNAMF